MKNLGSSHLVVELQISSFYSNVVKTIIFPISRAYHKNATAIYLLNLVLHYTDYQKYDVYFFPMSCTSYF